MCFPASPWAANWPLLSNLPPVCSLTFRSLYSSSLLVSLTAFSHDVVVCSELPAKVTQMLSMKIQPGIRARAEPSQGSLPRLKFKTASSHLHRNDIKYSLATICLLISLPAIKKIRLFPTFTYYEHVNISSDMPTPGEWHPLLWGDTCKDFQPSYPGRSPGTLFEL